MVQRALELLDEDWPPAPAWPPKPTDRPLERLELEELLVAPLPEVELEFWLALLL